MAASNRLDRRKNLSPLCISSFINQGLAPWRRKRGRGLQAADAGGLAPYHPWGLPRPVPLGRGWRPSRTTAQPLAAGFTSPVKSAERRSFGARLCRLTDAASPLRGKGGFWMYPSAFWKTEYKISPYLLHTVYWLCYNKACQ